MVFDFFKIEGWPFLTYRSYAPLIIFLEHIGDLGRGLGCIFCPSGGSFDVPAKLAPKLSTINNENYWWEVRSLKSTLLSKLMKLVVLGLFCTFLKWAMRGAKVSIHFELQICTAHFEGDPIEIRKSPFFKKAYHAPKN